MLQKKLATTALSAGGATFARFIYSSPLLLIGLWLYFQLVGFEIPPITMAFWAYATIGGIAQIIATIATVLLFQERNFAVGVTLTKTEVLMTIGMGFLILGDVVSGFGIFAVLLGLIGVILLSAKPGESLALGSFSKRAAALGIFAGLFFSMAAICYRGATLELAIELPLLRGAATLAAATTAQTLIMLVWLSVREPGEIKRVFSAWKSAGLIGIFSLLGSWGWFTAFSLQNAAYVKVVGQIEVLFSLAIAALVFKERVTQRELFGIALMTASIIGLILFA